MTVQPSSPSSGSSSTSSSLMTNWGFVQKESGDVCKGHQWAERRHYRNKTPDSAGWTMEGDLRNCCRTYIVSATTRRYAPPPGFLKLRLCPFLVLVACKCIGGEVANLKAGILTQEVRIWHPVGKRREKREIFTSKICHIHSFVLLSCCWIVYEMGLYQHLVVSAAFTRTPRPQNGWWAVRGHQNSRISIQMN